MTLAQQETLERAVPRPTGAAQAVSRRELLTLSVYFFLLVAVTDVLNVRLGIELLTLAVLVAATFITRAPRAFLRDWWFLLAGLLIWSFSGPVAAQSPFPAHLEFMYRLDRVLAFGHDPVRVVQLGLAGPHVGWIDVVSAIMYNMHLGEPYIAGYFLWRMRRTLYVQFAASLLILLVLGFATFIVFPAVPPWMAAEKVVFFHGTYYSTEWWDLATLKRLGVAHPYAFIQARGILYEPGILQRFGLVLHWHPLPFHGTPILYFVNLAGDPIAAMPSEHAAIPMIELLFFARLGKRFAVGFALWVLAVLFTVLYLGMHWLTDVLAGWLYAGGIVVFVVWFASRPSVARIAARR